MKHKFEPAENYGEGGMDSDWCKFKYCPNCGCLKEIWRNGTSFKMGNKFYDKEPKCDGNKIRRNTV